MLRWEPGGVSLQVDVSLEDSHFLLITQTSIYHQSLKEALRYNLVNIFLACSLQLKLLEL